MKIRTLIAASGWCVAISIAIGFTACGSHASKEKSVLSSDKRQCLYTWPTNENQWCFALIPFEQCDEFLRGQSSKSLGKCGLSDLMKALKALPEGSEVLWEDNPRRGFSYPPDDIIQQVTKIGQEQNIPVTITPLLTEKLPGVSPHN